MNNRLTQARLLFALSFMAAQGIGHAAPVQIDDRTDLQSNDSFSWAQLGVPCPGTCAPTPPRFCSLPNWVGSPFQPTSNSGLGAEVTNTGPGTSPEDQFRRAAERSVCFGWAGNFLLDDALLTTTVRSGGPVVIEFDEPVQGVGTQIQRFALGAFQASLKVYNEADELIGSFTSEGNSTRAQDNSAIFLGAYEDTPTIKKVEYSTPEGSVNRPFAINQLDIVRAPPACTILGDTFVLIGGNAEVAARPSSVCSNGPLKTAAKARVDTSLFALGDVQLGSGTLIDADVVTNGSVTTGVEVRVGDADGPDDLDMVSGGSIQLACGSGAEGICTYGDTLDGCGGCGSEVFDSEQPIAEPFVLPACDATGLPGGGDIKTGAKSEEYTDAFAGALGSGDYGKVIFGSGNQVEFSEGEYTFKSLRIGGETKLKILGPITVRVQNDLHFANGVEMELAEGVTPDQVVWMVDGEAEAEAEHRSGAKTVLYGTFCGPGSTITIGSGSDFTGAVVAKVVELGPKVNFTSYPAFSVFSD